MAFTINSRLAEIWRSAGQCRWCNRRKVLAKEPVLVGRPVIWCYGCGHQFDERGNDLTTGHEEQWWQ